MYSRGPGLARFGTCTFVLQSSGRQSDLGKIVPAFELCLTNESDLLHQEFTLRSEEHTSELQSHLNLVCRLLLEKKKKKNIQSVHNDSVIHLNRATIVWLVLQ